MLRAVIKTFLPKPMELSSVKQQSIRSPRQWGKVRVLPDATAVKDHGVTTVTTSVSEDCQGVFLIFFQKFIMKAVFEHKFTFFLGCKTAAGWTYDPQYL